MQGLKWERQELRSVVFSLLVPTFLPRATLWLSFLFRHMQGLEWERGELRRQLQQDRAEFAAQAKLLSGHFQTSMHRSTALQVAHEALQVGVDYRRR
eukprot:1147632-Pelagomonas_calceolata.AAC.3